VEWLGILRKMQSEYLIYGRRIGPESLRIRNSILTTLPRSSVFKGEGCSGSESTVTEATTGLLYQPQMMDDDDDECGAVGGMLGRGSRSTRRKMPSAALSTINFT
jgi:hypothetical protein